MNGTFASEGRSIEVSIFLPQAPFDISVLNRFESDLGVKFKSVKWYLDWSDSFTPDVAERLHSHGVIPELTWQPQLNRETGFTIGVSNTDVTSHKYDAYLNSFAQSVKSLGYTIRISLAPEMNLAKIDRNPWGMGNVGNNPQNYIEFWRYVVNKFRSLGANNVQWIWSPNVRYIGDTGPLNQFYPGDGHVDYLGLDGYNWGSDRWQSFSQVFGASYRELTNLTSKNILIMETASTEVGGSKAAWITDMFNQLKSSFPKIAGFTWFNIDKETDWRIESSASSKQAFIQGVKNMGIFTASNSSQSSKSITKNQTNNTTNQNPSQNPTTNNTIITQDQLPIFYPPKAPFPISGQYPEQNAFSNSSPSSLNRYGILISIVLSLLAIIGGYFLSRKPIPSYINQVIENVPQPAPASPPTKHIDTIIHIRK